MPDDQRQADTSKFPPWANWLLLAGFVALLYFVFSDMTPEPRRYEIDYTHFKELVAEDRVSEVLIRGRAVQGSLLSAQPLGPDGESAQRFTTRLPEFGDERLLPLLENHGVSVRIGEDRAERGWVAMLLALLPWLILFGFFYWLMRRSSQAMGGRFGGPGELKKFLERSTEQAGVPDVTFDDVAGQENAKREVTELVDYLGDPERFRRMGAAVPRGVLLMGAPGTGKTLLGRALAGQAGVPFYSISASEFIEMYVGVGASRVRNLFDKAKKNAPSIVFIDELDSVGRTRGTGVGGGHDEREQTLNQILAEMDGFEGHEAVIVIAATNRPDVLDPALLRPGRFDRHVTLDLPDKNERLAILKVHTRKVPLAKEVDFQDLAAGTSGFSGADLKNLVNEAAMFATRGGRERVTMSDFEEARDKLLLGTVRTLAIQSEERHRLAVHESGHTLVAYHMKHTDPLYKVTIIPRGHALGGTHQLPEQERHTLPEDYLRDRLAVTLAGRNAEKELLGTVSSGADDDIQKATSLARNMVSRWGMDEDIGPMDLREGEEQPFLGREVARSPRYSEHAARSVDKAVSRLLAEAEKRARGLIRDQRDRLEQLVAELEQHETLHRGEIEAILGDRTEDTGAATGKPDRRTA